MDAADSDATDDDDADADADAAADAAAADGDDADTDDAALPTVDDDPNVHRDPRTWHDDDAGPHAHHRRPGALPR